MFLVKVYLFEIYLIEKKESKNIQVVKKIVYKIRTYIPYTYIDK